MDLLNRKSAIIGLMGQGKRLVFLIGLATLALTAFLWLRELHLEEKRAREIFKGQSNLIANEIESQFDRYVNLMRSSAGAHFRMTETHYRDWRDYVSSLDVSRNYPAITGFGFVRHVREQDKEAFVRGVREDRPDFKIFPDRSYPDHYVNVVLEPENAYRAVGFDVASREDRKEAAERARDSGKIAITGKTALIIPGATGSDVLLYLPLYRGGGVPESVERRRMSLSGWMVIGMAIPRIMANILERTGAVAEIAIYDGDEALAERLLFSTSDDALPAGGRHFRQEIRRDVAGRAWLIEFNSTQAFEDSVQTGRAFIILAGGAAAAILMALTAWVLLSARSRAEAKASARLSELEHERDFANALLSSSPAAILTLDEHGRITKANKRSAEIAGIFASDMSGKTFSELFVASADQAYFHQRLSALAVGGEPLTIEFAGAAGRGSVIVNWTFQAVRETAQQARYFVAAGIDITLRRQAEDALKAERALFVAGPVVVFRWRAEPGWPVEYVSPNVTQFGCHPNRMIADEKPFVDLIHPDDLGRVADEVARLTAQGVASFEQKYRLVRPNDGGVRWIEDRTIIERDGRGRALRYLGYLVDVTEREKSMESRRESELRIARVLETSTEGYWELDADWRTVAVNPALLNMLEIDEASIMGRKLQEFIAPGWEDKMQADVNERRIATNRNYDMAFVTASGRILHAKISATTTFDQHGKMIGSFGLLTDVTAEKIVEAAIVSEQGRLKQIVEALPLAFAVTRLDQSVVINANQAACALFGLTEDEMIGRSSCDFYSDAKDRAGFIKQLTAQKYVSDFEVAMKRKDGSRFLAMMSARLVAFDGVDCALISCVDITTRKEAEAKLSSMAGELARSNAELEQFAYVASHDLQEPLRMISSYVQLLERRYKDKLDNDAREYIHFAADGAKRMQALITDLLEFSRVNRKGNPFASVDLNRAVVEAKANLAVSIAETNATISVGHLPEVSGDAAQLVRLFQNLIGNAVKYHHPQRRPEVRVLAQEDGRLWRISVQDNGIGIAATYFERIFVIFQRLHTRSDYPGTGIGLALCKKIVERHGGEIGVTSKEGAGSTFFFTIPR